LAHLLPDPARPDAELGAVDRRALGDIGQGRRRRLRPPRAWKYRGGSETVPSWVPESEMRPMNSKNYVARRIVPGMPAALIAGR
jgi:hypothetical protein